jgi:hypothetical protein
MLHAVPGVSNSLWGAMSTSTPRRTLTRTLGFGWSTPGAVHSRNCYLASSQSSESYIHRHTSKGPSGVLRGSALYGKRELVRTVRYPSFSEFVIGARLRRNASVAVLPGALRSGLAPRRSLVQNVRMKTLKHTIVNCIVGIVYEDVEVLRLPS